MNKFVQMKNFVKKASVPVLAFGLSMAAGSSHAALDITADAATTKTDILAAGVVVLGIYMAVRSIKWVRSALS